MVARNWSANARRKSKSVREAEDSYNLKRRNMSYSLYPNDIEQLRVRCDKEGVEVQDVIECFVKAFIRGNIDVLALIRRHLAIKTSEFTQSDANDIYAKLRAESILDDPIIDEDE